MPSASAVPWRKCVFLSGLADVAAFFPSIAKKVASERFGPHKKVRRDMLGPLISRGLYAVGG